MDKQYWFNLHDNVCNQKKYKKEYPKIQRLLL